MITALPSSTLSNRASWKICPALFVKVKVFLSGASTEPAQNIKVKIALLTFLPRVAQVPQTVCPVASPLFGSDRRQRVKTARALHGIAACPSVCLPTSIDYGRRFVIVPITTNTFERTAGCFERIKTWRKFSSACFGVPLAALPVIRQKSCNYSRRFEDDHSEEVESILKRELRSLNDVQLMLIPPNGVHLEISEVHPKGKCYDCALRITLLITSFSLA